MRILSFFFHIFFIKKQDHEDKAEIACFHLNVRNKKTKQIVA